MSSHLCQKKISLSSLLFPLVREGKPRFEKAMYRYIERFQKAHPDELGQALIYAIEGEGKRVRPSFVYGFSAAFKEKKEEEIDSIALAIELFHTASIIADDLPCMDDETLRRNRLPLHRKFDEKTAILTSFSLIAESYRLIAEAGAKGRGTSMIIETSLQTGIEGACQGQFLDLQMASKEERSSKERLFEIHTKKTAALFTLTFTLPWMLFGGDEEKLDQVRKSAFHIGLAFQIMDDIDDFEEDQKRAGLCNLCTLLGKEESLSLFYREMVAFREEIDKLSLRLGPFGELVSMIDRF